MLQTRFFCCSCYNVFWLLVQADKLSQLHLVFGKKTKHQWQTRNLEDRPIALHNVQPTDWRPSGQSYWKTCLIPCNRCKLTFREHVQQSSNNRMFLCGPVFCLVGWLVWFGGCWFVGFCFFHKCNLSLKILVQMHIYFPQELQWHSKNCKIVFLLFRSFSIYVLP